MIPRIALICLFLNALWLSTASAQCEKGFHIIVARAAGETPGEGSTGTLAKAIVAKIPDSDSKGLNYPALPIAYMKSEQKGVANLHSTIQSYVQSCPAAKIVLLGYDQGAFVIADVLGGSGTKATGFINGKYAEAINGIILFSDPSYVPGQPYDAGTNTNKSGRFPRSAASLEKMARFSKIMKSYCIKGDTQCTNGNNATANRQYLTDYEEAATNFIVGLYN